MAARSHWVRSWSAQQHGGPVGVGASRAARVLEQDQGEQAGRPGVVGAQPVQQPGEPQRLGDQRRAGQLGAGRGGVALVEHQVGRGEHGVPALGQVVGGRHPVGDAGQPDLLPGAGQPLGHGGLGDEEGAGDLLRAEAAEGAQGQGDPGLRGEAGVAAGEHEPQQVVLDDLGPGVLLGQHGAGERPEREGLLGPAGRLAADQVDGAAAGRGAQPGNRAVGDAVARPGLQRAQAGVLHGVLGEREVAGPAGEGGEDVTAGDPDDLGQGAVRVLGGELRARPRGDGTHIGNSMTGRTSTAPSQAPGMVAATRTASSRSAHSSR